MINVGFVGLGNMGMGQVGSFAQVRGCKIVAGADPSKAARARFAEKYPGRSTYASHKELLADASVDAVVIVAPTKLHKQIAIDCMKAGRHVLSEKPMARTVRDCRAMINASEKTGKLLMVAHCRRYDADWGCFGDIVRKGMLGGPILWRHCMAGAGPNTGWFMDEELGGGPLIDGAVHDQDFANYLFGKPEFVQASAIKMTKHTAIDTASAVIHYESGDQLMLSWSWGVGHGSHMQDAIGPKATAVFRPQVNDPKIDPSVYACYQVTDLKTQKVRIVKKKRNKMYVEQAKHFIACIDGKAKCLSSGEESIKAVASAEALLKAAAKNGSAKIKW